ncbi:MAG TPA: hypothetical protein VJG32_00360 [Anaerolineae bacterium]|nr:hypothetical protein [Anaerolineae bacterium]
MNGRIVFSVLLVLVLVAAIVGVGAYVYNAGLTQGLAESGRLGAPESGAAPYPYYAPYFHQPFGFGFFGLLFPLLFIFLVFGLLRGLFWRARGGWGRAHQHWPEGVPPMVEEWHRRMHQPQSEQK